MLFPTMEHAFKGWERAMIGGLLLLLMVSTSSWAGGGPMQVMVLYHGQSEAALQVAVSYQEARSLPEDHLCGLDGIEFEKKEISLSDFQVHIEKGLEECLERLADPDLIDYLVVVRGLPYRVLLDETSGDRVSFSALLQIHRVRSQDDGALLMGQPHPRQADVAYASVGNPVFTNLGFFPDDFQVENQYVERYPAASGLIRMGLWPKSFRRQDALDDEQYAYRDNLFLVTRLDGFDFEDAHALIARGSQADGKMPTEPFLCMAGADNARRARDSECELTIRMLQSLGFSAKYISSYDSNLSGENVMSYFTGAENLTEAIAGQTYAPGALADNLTSFGGAPNNFFCDESGNICPENEVQTSMARFVRAGATGVHGTVAEPLNNSFPGAGMMLLYALGYNLAESWYFVQPFLYWQNTFLGDPLTSPFASRPVIDIEMPPELSIDQTIAFRAEHPNGIAQIHLYLDGKEVSSAQKGDLTWTLQGAVGETQKMLVVAIANNENLIIEGWPTQELLSQPEIQGWKAVEVTIEEKDLQQDEPTGGCTCQATNMRESFCYIFGLLLFAGWRRTHVFGQKGVK